MSTETVLERVWADDNVDVKVGKHRASRFFLYLGIQLCFAASAHASC